MKQTVLALLLLPLLSTASNHKASLFWLEGLAQAKKADSFWQKQQYELASNYYLTAVESIKDVKEIDQSFYPETVNSCLKRLADRQKLCEELAKPLDDLSPGQLKELVVLQRQRIGRLLDSAPKTVKSPDSKSVNQALRFKVKALKDQVRDLKSTIKRNLLKESPEEVKKQSELLSVQTSACMVVTDNVLAEFDNHSKEMSEINKRMRVLSIRNQQLQQQLEASEDAQAMELLQSELEKANRINKKLLTEKVSLMQKAKLLQNRIDEIGKGKSDKTDFATKYLIAQNDNDRLNAMLDALQESNRKLREKIKENQNIIDQFIKKTPKEADPTRALKQEVEMLMNKNKDQKVQLANLEFLYDGLKSYVETTARDSVVESGQFTNRVSDELELQRLREEVVRLKSINSLLADRSEAEQKELMELIRSLGFRDAGAKATK